MRSEPNRANRLPPRIVKSFARKKTKPKCNQNGWNGGPEHSMRAQ